MKKEMLGEGDFGEFYMKRSRLIEYASDSGKTYFFIQYSTTDEKGEVLILVPDYEFMDEPLPPDNKPAEWHWVCHRKNVFEINKDWMNKTGLFQYVMYEITPEDSEIFIEYDADNKKGQFTLFRYHE